MGEIEQNNVIVADMDSGKWEKNSCQASDEH